MPTRAGLLAPRGAPSPYRDVAQRERLIRAQRLPFRAPRLRARRRLRLVSLLRALVACLGLATIGILGWQAGRFLLTDALFEISDVRVEGVDRLSPATIREAAAVEGQNLFAADLARARARVEALPGVERVHVTREWPNRIEIVVKEREPFALINAGQLYWMDAEGVILRTLSQIPVAPGPILSGVEVERMGLGTKLASDRLAQGLSFLRELHRAHGSLAALLSEVDLSRPIGVVLYTLDGIEVRVGSERWEERLARLEALLESLSERGEPVGSIDLRFQDLVVLRPRGDLRPRGGR